MERYCVMDDEKIVNITLWDPELPKNSGWVPAPEGAEIGDEIIDGELVKVVKEPEERPGDRLRRSLQELLMQAEASGVSLDDLLK